MVRLINSEDNDASLRGKILLLSLMIIGLVSFGIYHLGQHSAIIAHNVTGELSEMGYESGKFDSNGNATSKNDPYSGLYYVTLIGDMKKENNNNNDFTYQKHTCLMNKIKALQYKFNKKYGISDCLEFLPYWSLKWDNSLMGNNGYMVKPLKTAKFKVDAFPNPDYIPDDMVAQWAHIDKNIMNQSNAPPKRSDAQFLTSDRKE